MNDSIAPDCIKLSSRAYQAYQAKIDTVVNEHSIEAATRDEIELCRERYVIHPQSGELVIQVFNVKNQPIITFCVSPGEYQVDTPLKACQTCGVLQSMHAMNERLEQSIYCPKNCHACHLMFDTLRQKLSIKNRAIKMLKPLSPSSARAS